ncbi:MAG: pantoate--beta-alanine ligase [Kiritimatiellae bacterium]|nr:pantoate--beta-alanine ligase [Kiritimatiellia bacterium]
MDVVTDPIQMQALALEGRSRAVKVALVPTMGYLHEGHLSLVRLAKTRAERVVLSLFVNPTQFGPQEDLDRYPRSVERDLELCEREGVSVVFMPEAGSMYAQDASVKIEENALSQGLCGESRPGHFSGVLTVVAKLFLLTQPDVAVFGEKDAQQLRLIRRMVRDLNLPIEIIPGPIVREPDGLAMSSRNTNLSTDERAQAAVLRRSLLAVKAAVTQGERQVERLRATVMRHLAEAPLGTLDYLSFVDDETLTPVDRLVDRPVLAAMAVQFPRARLIDNLTLIF